MAKGKQLFVTVGSTKFDLLIQEFLPINESGTLVNTLVEFGYHNLVMQVGNSVYQKLDSSSSIASNISVDIYEFKPDLNKDYCDSDLIVSHAGSGSILESLRLGKRLIVVVNDSLADNHQIELAEELAKSNYLALCTPR